MGQPLFAAERESPERFSTWLLLRSLVGLILAPTLGGAIFVSSPILISVAQLRGGGEDLLGSLAMGGLFGCVIGAPGALLLGWPLHLLLLHLRWTHPLAYVGFGAPLGLLVITGFLAWMGSRSVLPTTPEELTSHAAVLIGGGFGGLLFWLLRRPDRDHARGGRSGSNATRA